MQLKTAMSLVRLGWRLKSPLQTLLLEKQVLPTKETAVAYRWCSRRAEVVEQSTLSLWPHL